ncbi:MAG: DUF6443 domain-containing protein, partial [Chloroflexales bacterium]|nr:DUF6443 domain-containing protein [Chloroflexales bacterium]
RMGTLTRVTDANDNATMAAYDEFGRMMNRARSWDNTVQIAYYDQERPVCYMVQTRAGDEAADPWNGVQQLYDGLGRLIQTKRESADHGAQQIATHYRYDGLGRVRQEGQPYYHAGPWAAYVPPDSSVRWTTTSYDGIGRVSDVTAPDGSVTQIRYWMSATDTAATTTDAKGHKTRREFDMIGRLRKVIEYSGNGGSEGAYAVDATTTYAYTPLDQLRVVRDALGNTTRCAMTRRGGRPR